MTLRDNISVEKNEAHRILDAYRAGVPTSTLDVLWALRVLGDLIGYAP